MTLRDIVIKWNPKVEESLAESLTQHLDMGDGAIEDQTRDLTWRLYQDQGRLPWTAATQLWLKATTPALADEFMAALGKVVFDEDVCVAYGATLLALALHGEHPELEGLLFEVARQHGNEGIRRMTGAYLLATPSTQEATKALFREDVVIGPLIDRENRVDAITRDWSTALYRNFDQSQWTDIRRLVTQNPDYLFELENTFLDIFDSAEAGKRQKLLEIILHALASQEPELQRIACDLLTEPTVLEESVQSVRPRLQDCLLDAIRSDSQTVKTAALQLLQEIIRTSAAGCPVDEDPNQEGLKYLRQVLASDEGTDNSELLLQAEGCFLAAISENPGHYKALNNQGVVLLRRALRVSTGEATKLLTEAIRYFEKALEKVPGAPEITFNLAVAYGRYAILQPSGDGERTYRHALGLFDRAVKANSGLREPLRWFTAWILTHPQAKSPHVSRFSQSLLQRVPEIQQTMVVQRSKPIHKEISLDLA